MVEEIRSDRALQERPVSKEDGMCKKVEDDELEVGLTLKVAQSKLDSSEKSPTRSQTEEGKGSESKTLQVEALAAIFSASVTSTVLLVSKKAVPVLTRSGAKRRESIRDQHLL